MSDQIFISYRRNDAAYVTGHINDLLRREFGDEAVFTDVDNIALGVDFRAVIDETVSQCQVFLAVIGSDWLSARGHDGKPRLQDPADFVRIEVESALKRNIPVIPLLVSGAQMPAAEDLPDSLRDLAYRNGTPIRPAPDFAADMTRLIKNLKKHFDALRTAADPVAEAEAEAALADRLQEASTASKDASGRDSATKQGETVSVPIHVSQDESARRRVALGIGQQKKNRWATSLWGLAIVVGAVAGWYYVEQNPEVVQGIMSGVQTVPAETDGGASDNAEPVPAAGDVIAPTSFSPAAMIEVSEEPGAEPGIDAIAATDAEPAFDEAAADPVAQIASSENVTDNVTVAAPEPAVDAAVGTSDPSESAEELVDIVEGSLAAGPDAVVETNADDEVTLTPGSQRQSDASALISDGVRLAGVGDHEVAIQNFTEALPLDVEPAFVYKQRGASYQALGQFEAAVQDYGQSIQLNSEDLITIYNRGVSHMALQDYAPAIADFDVVIGLDPEFVDAYSRRADAHEAMGNTEAATRDRAIVSVFESNRDNPR